MEYIKLLVTVVASSAMSIAMLVVTALLLPVIAVAGTVAVLAGVEFNDI